MKTLLKVLLVVCVFATSSQFIYSQSQYADFDWAIKAGGTFQDFASGSMAVDSEGNSFITGYFQGTASFGDYTLTASGTDDIYVAKVSPQGAFLWAVKADIDDTGQDFSIYITADNVGNSYLTGNFRGTITLGTTTFTAAELATDIFIAKLDSAGQIMWAQHAAGQQYNWAVPKDITVDQSGNSYITGAFKYNYAVTFGANLLTGDGGGFVAKLDTSGAFLWSVKADGISAGDEFAMGIAVDGDGNSYFTGQFFDTATFGTSALVSSGSTDIFVAKLSSQGQYVWVTQAGGQDPVGDTANGIAVDGSGNCYLSGSFSGLASFGNIALNSAGLRDIFVAKINSEGQFLWASRAGGGGHDYGYDMVSDSSGSVYITGNCGSLTAEFGNTVLNISGAAEGYIARLDPQGQFMTAELVDETNVRAVALDGQGSAYISGSLGGPSTFGDTTLTQSGGGDIYIAKRAGGALGMPEITDAGLNAYPNPGDGIFRISSSHPDEIESIRVYSTSGQLVFNGSISGNGIIDISNQPAGIYIVQLNGIKTVRNIKLLKK
ncbi:T9SS type A sorting domain-containing protein [uncultured Flavobacterium sp.]|uniref:T9SS type A sorting domain-containing protein n=1 Tax=uncultured Flavobacterium sp. TaxID=165435 RepID=UPI0025F0B591|nr:T9SS type A sorting domain-containing protein [uncultured Flavobacterium sp.]